MSTCVKHMFMTTYVEHILPGNCLSQAWLKIFTNIAIIHDSSHPKLNCTNVNFG